MRAIGVGMASKHFILGELSREPEKTLVIMGAPRGGTSMVAGSFRELGVDLGVSLGENHEDPQFLTKDLEELRGRIAERNAVKPVWGWKMPHSIHYIEELLPDIRNPHLVFVFRNLLSTSASQVHRSESTVENALKFSLKQNIVMTELVSKLDVPMLLVDYDKALTDNAHYIDKAIEFMQLDVTSEQRQNCVDFIDPDTGYKQISSSHYEVERVNIDDYPEPVQIRRVNRQVEQDKEQGGLVATGPHPLIIYRRIENRAIPNEFVLKMVNRTSEKTTIKLMFDFEWQFSHNMSLTEELEPGVTAFKIKTKGDMKRIAVKPEVHDGRSDIVFLETRKA